MNFTFNKMIMFSVLIKILVSQMAFYNTTKVRILFESDNQSIRKFKKINQ